MATFLLHYITLINEWKNFDLLTTCRSRDTDRLYLKILQIIPSMPFDELILQKNDHEKPRRELPQVINPQAMFPFFPLISTLLDKKKKYLRCQNSHALLHRTSVGAQIYEVY